MSEKHFFDIQKTTCKLRIGKKLLLLHITKKRLLSEQSGRREV